MRRTIQPNYIIDLQHKYGNVDVRDQKLTFRDQEEKHAHL